MSEDKERRNKYSKYPDHPLREVSQEILDAARSVLQEAVDTHDVDPEQAEPIADSVVIALLPWINSTGYQPIGTSDAGTRRNRGSEWAFDRSTLLEALRRIESPERRAGGVGWESAHAILCAMLEETTTDSAIDQPIGASDE